MGFSRSFKISLLISTLIHVAAFSALTHEGVARRIQTGPVAMLKEKPKTAAVRFELIDTPASAKTDEPPPKTNLISDKNTRAQDRFEGDKKQKDLPHMEGKQEDSKDTRPRMIAAKPSVEPPRPAVEAEKKETAVKNSEAVKSESGKNVEKDLPKPPFPEQEKKSESDQKIEIQPEPKEKEVVRIARKSSESMAPVIPKPAVTPSRMMSAASSSNMGADAQITGDLSFAASQHFFGEYLLKMKQAIERQWISRLVSKYTGVMSSRAEIDFKIQPDGSVTDIVVNSGEGDPYFPIMCVSSINDAQPFDAIPYEEAQGLPEQFIGKPLNIRFTFRYN